MLTSIAGKSVIVTGSSKGIGKGIAGVFAEKGAKVLIVGRNLDSAQATAAEINAAGGTAAAASKKDESEAWFILLSDHNAEQQSTATNRSFTIGHGWPCTDATGQTTPASPEQQRPASRRGRLSRVLRDPFREEPQRRLVSSGEVRERIVRQLARLLSKLRGNLKARGLLRK